MMASEKVGIIALNYVVVLDIKNCTTLYTVWHCSVKLYMNSGQILDKKSVKTQAASLSRSTLKFATGRNSLEISLNHSPHYSTEEFSEL